MAKTVKYLSPIFNADDLPRVLTPPFEKVAN
jgi:hypothetical protein